MATLLKQRVAKYTLDITANYTEAVTNSKGAFVAADVNATADTITIEGHAFKTGDMVAMISGTGITPPTVPAIRTAYWIIVIDNNTVALGASLADAQAGTRAALNVGPQDGLCYLVKQAFGTITTDIVLPAGAIVTRAYYDVVTVFTGGTVIGTVNDNTTIALSTGVSANDLVSAITIKDATNVWDAGVHGTLAGNAALSGDAATAIAVAALNTASTVVIKVTTACNPTIAIAAETLFGGKLELYIEYAA